MATPTRSARNIEALQDSGMAALMTLVTGGSKIQAAFAAIQQAILTKAIGPLSNLTGMSLGVIASIKKMSSEFGAMGAVAKDSMEKVERSFKPFLKNLEAIQSRMLAIKKLAADQNMFGTRELTQANRLLESYSKGALGTQRALRMVGDAAAAANQDIAETSQAVGELYGSLKNGDPIGSAAEKLEKMGIITAQARQSLEMMQKGGAAFTQMWAVMDAELGRSSGGMQSAVKSLDDLKSKLADVKEEMSAGFGAGFLEGEKNAIEANIKVMEMLKPATDQWGKSLGTINSSMSNFQANMVGAITKLPGIQSAIAAAGYAFGIFSSIISVISGVGLVKFAASMMSSARAINTVAAASGGIQAAGAAFKGMAAQAMAGNVALAAQAGKIGLVTTATTGMGAAFNGVKYIFKGLFTGLGGTLTLLLTALSVLVGSLMVYHNNLKAAAEALRLYNAETEAMIKNSATAADAIATASDLMAAYAKNTALAADAYDDLAKAQADGDDDRTSGARSRIEALIEARRKLDNISQTRPLRKTEAHADYLVERSLQSAREGEAAEMSRIELLPASERNAAKRSFYERQISESRSARATVAGSFAAQDSSGVIKAQMEGGRSDRASILQNDIRQREIVMRERMAGAYRMTQAEGMAAQANPTQAAAIMAEKQARAAQIERDATAEIEQIRARIAALGTGEEDDVAIAERSGNELAVLRAKLALYQQYKAAQASPGPRLDALTSSASRAFGGTSNIDDMAQRMQMQMRVMEAEAGRKGDVAYENNAIAGLAELSKGERGNLASEQLEATERIVQLQDNQTNAQLLSIELAKQRIALEVTFGNLTQQAAEARMAALERESSRVAEIAARRKSEIMTDAEASVMDAGASSLRANGDTASARVIEKAAQRKRSDAAYEQRRRAVLSETNDPEAAERIAASERDAANAGFDIQQAKEARGQRMAKGEQGADQKANDLDNKAAEARRAGMLTYAAALREAAARVKEEASKEGRILEAQEKYGVSKEEATKMIEKEIESSRKLREIEEKRRKLEEKLLKDRIEAEREAEHAENGGNKGKADKIRDKQKRREREQELKDAGYSESDAKGGARQEYQETRRGRANDAYQAAYAAWEAFMREMAELMKKRKEYLDDLENLRLRAQGNDYEADKNEKQKEFDAQVQALVDNLRLPVNEAQALANEQNRLKFEIDKRQRLEALQSQYEEQKSERIKASREAPQRVLNGPTQSSLGRVGGAAARTGIYNDIATDVSKVAEHTRMMRDLLEQIAVVSSEQYVVHSVTKPSVDKRPSYR